MKRKTLKFSLFLLSMALHGCASIGYYGQSIQGQMEILAKRQPIQRVLDANELDTQTLTKLEYVLQVLEFAEQELLLPNNGSYQSYAELNRRYVVWNVFATPALSLEPQQWCFLFVGCLSYRGYFNKETAMEYAQALELQSLDVFVGGVAAYSTLGWFDDPVLNTMLHWDKVRLTRVILHELTHQKWYVRDDTAFNEALADSVSLIGVERWLHKTATIDEIARFRREQKYESAIIDLILDYKDRLQNLYSSNLSEQEKIQEKQRVLHELAQEYWTAKQTWHGYNAFDAWFTGRLNNAQLSAISTYREFVPGFLSLYDSVHQDLGVFYQRVSQLSQCEQPERHRLLKNQIVQFTCQ